MPAGMLFVYLCQKNQAFRMCLLIQRFFLFFFISSIFGQVQEEVNPPPHIKTIIFKGPTEDQFPVIKLGERMTLEFDDLTASEQDYYYKIVHCDYDWTPSQLLRSQYLVGMDNQRIIDYGNSYTTLQPYSNYRLAIPNENVHLKVSGNYVLEIYDSVGNLQFSRRFVVYRNLVTVGGTVKRSRDFNFLNERQAVQFFINTAVFPVVNPKKEIKVAIVQNHFWPTALYNIKPQFTVGTELVYRYDQETSFHAGNEFLNFDTKDLRATNFAISRIELGTVYDHYLFTDEFRRNRPYTYFPDINGDFTVRTLQGEDAAREAEYTKVHFSIPYSNEIGLDSVYIIGKFNNYDIGEANRMELNGKEGKMELSLLMKQGFYNYKYVIERQDGSIDLNYISGNHHFAENNYLILVYYRDFGDLHDSIIGIGAVNSRNISN